MTSTRLLLGRSCRELTVHSKALNRDLARDLAGGECTGVLRRQWCAAVFAVVGPHGLVSVDRTADLDRTVLEFTAANQFLFLLLKGAGAVALSVGDRRVDLPLASKIGSRCRLTKGKHGKQSEREYRATCHVESFRAWI